MAEQEFEPRSFILKTNSAPSLYGFSNALEYLNLTSATNQLDGLRQDIISQILPPLPTYSIWQ